MPSWLNTSSPGVKVTPPNSTGTSGSPAPVLVLLCGFKPLMR
jgi:hypothetical protein